MADRDSGSAVAVTALVAMAVVIVAAIAAGTLLLLDSDDGTAPAASPTGAAASTLSSTPTDDASAGAATDEATDEAGASEDPFPTLTARAGPGDVADLPAGLFCRDLMADGYSYSAAVGYWSANGQPDQMDEDRNGIPCQTVYSPGDVSSYWGETAVPDAVASPVESLPSGLLCRDLLGRGYSYPDAVAYWFLWDLPDRMDSDLNGIPCETVYPASDVDVYWYG